MSDVRQRAEGAATLARFTRCVINSTCSGRAVRPSIIGIREIARYLQTRLPRSTVDPCGLHVTRREDRRWRGFRRAKTAPMFQTVLETEIPRGYKIGVYRHLHAVHRITEPIQTADRSSKRPKIPN